MARPPLSLPLLPAPSFRSLLPRLGALGGGGSHPKVPGERSRHPTSAGEMPQAASPQFPFEVPSATLGPAGDGSLLRAPPAADPELGAGGQGTCPRPGRRPLARTHLADTARAAGAPGGAWPGRAPGARWGSGAETGGSAWIRGRDVSAPGSRSGSTAGTGRSAGFQSWDVSVLRAHGGDPGPGPGGARGSGARTGACSGHTAGIRGRDRT